MRLARTSLVLLAIAIPVLAQPPTDNGKISLQFSGKGGPGGRGGFMAMMGGNPDELFNQFSKGKDVIRRDDLDPFQQMFFDRATRQMNISNGQITREQFKEVFSQMQNRMQNGGGGGPPSPEQTDRLAEQRFRFYDKNNDGLLSPDEMPEALRNEREKWDTNKDGFIDLNEFKAYFRSRFEQRGNGGDTIVFNNQDQSSIMQLPVQEQETDVKRPVVFRAGHLPPGLPDWFTKLDIDNDGQIGLYEWVKGGKPINEFREMDYNDDGFLTAEEVLRFMRGGKGPLVNVSSSNGSTSDSAGNVLLNNLVAPTFNSRGGNGNGNNGPPNRGGDSGNGNNNWNRWMGGFGGDRPKGGGDRGKGGDRNKDGGPRSKGGDRNKDAR
jgi:Ca2+-binding EF-hand superfamily protein